MLLRSVCSRSYKRAREGTGLPSLWVACLWVSVLLDRSPTMEKRGSDTQSTRGKKERTEGVRRYPSLFSYLSVTVGPAVLANGDGDHSFPTPGSVQTVAGGNGHGTPWMTPHH